MRNAEYTFAFGFVFIFSMASLKNDDEKVQTDTLLLHKSQITSHAHKTNTNTHTTHRRPPSSYRSNPYSHQRKLCRNRLPLYHHHDPLHVPSTTTIIISNPSFVKASHLSSTSGTAPPPTTKASTYIGTIMSCPIGPPQSTNTTQIKSINTIPHTSDTFMLLFSQSVAYIQVETPQSSALNFMK